MARAALALLLALPVSSGFQFDRLDPEVVATLQHEDLSTAWGSDIGPNATWFAAHVARREVFLARGGGAYAPDELATLRSALLAPFVSDGAPRTRSRARRRRAVRGDAAAAALLAGLGAPEPVASDAREAHVRAVAKHGTCATYDASEMSGLEVCDDFELGPGDLLFLPQGAVHSARATEAEGSTHLTLGLAGTRAAVCDEQAPAGDLMAEFRRQLDEGDLGLCDISSTGCPPNTYSSSGYYAGKDCQDWPYLCGGGCDNGCDDSHSGCDDECDSCCTCTNCEDCPGGRYSSGSATGCAACPQGTYTFGGEDCTSCPAGYYGASSGLDANAGAFVALGAGACADWTEFAAYCPSDAGACRPEGRRGGGYVATGIFTRVAGYWESWSSFERYCPDVSGGCGYGYDTDNALGLPASVSLEGCQDQCMEAGCDAIYWSQGHGCGNYFGGHLQGDGDSAGQVEYYEFSTTDAGDSLEACQDLCTSEQCDGIYFDADDSTGYGCAFILAARVERNAQGMDYYYWSHGCSECASGRYSSVDGATGCKSCPSGTYAEAGRSTCTTCAAGSYAGSGASNCTACPTGYVSTGETGAISLETACTLCEAGTYDAGTECVTCPGTYSGDAATECTDCPAGRYWATTARREWDLDSNNILTYAEVTACLAPRQRDEPRRHEQHVWSVPVPEPIVASTDDCDTADSLYTVSIVQATGAISDTDDFKIRAFGNNDVKLSYSCEVWDDDTGTASATFPTSYGLRKIFFLVKSDDVDDAAITITVSQPSGMSSTWDATLSQDDNDDYFSYTIETDQKEYYTNDDDDSTVLITSMVTSAMASLQMSQTYYWGGSTFIDSYAASFPSTSDSSDVCGASLDTPVDVTWAYTEDAYPDPDDDAGSIVYRQCGYLNGIEMDDDSFPSDYSRRGGSDADAALTSIICMVGLRVLGAPLDILPDMGNGAAGFNGVTLTWLDTYNSEGEFNVDRRSQGTSASSNTQVADVLVPSSKCGATVAPLTFTDTKTGYTPGARVVYTVVANPNWADQDTDMTNFTGTTVYTVPWLSLFTVSVVTSSGAGTPVPDVYVSVSHMLDSTTMDPSYDPVVYGYTDVNGDYSPLIRIVDETWSASKQYFNAVTSTHVYGGNANIKDETSVSVRGYLRSSSWEPEATAGQCYCALPSGQTIYMLRESGSTDSYSTDDLGYFEFAPMIGELVTVYFEGYAGSDNNTAIDFKVSTDVDDDDAVVQTKVAAPSITFTTDGTRTWTSSRAPTASLRRLEAGSSNNRIDQWFNDLYLNELTGVDMSNGDVQENFTYTAPICLSFVELLPLVSGELTPIEFDIDITLNDRISGLTTTISDEYDLTVDYTSILAFSREFDGSEVDFDRVMAVLGTAPDNVYAYLSDKSEAATACNDDPTEGPQYCVVTQNTYEWFPETVTTYVLSASQIEQQMTRLAKQKTDADCSDSTSWYASGNPSEDCDYVAEYASNDDTAQSRCQLTDDTGVNASSACPIACDTCPSASLSAAELEEIQQAIDNWQTVLKNYRATSDRDEVATLQTHINSILSSISSTFTTRTARAARSGDETCDVYSKMQSSLEMVNNLLGICDDFDMVTLPSFTAFCSVPENNGDDLLPNYMLDTVGDGTRYITFGAGAEIEMEYAFTQTSTLEQVVGYAAEAEFSASLFAESKLNIVGAETEEEMALTTRAPSPSSSGGPGEEPGAEPRGVDLARRRGDGGVFAVKIETDTVYGTPIFTTIGGESTCPGETATTRRAEEVTIFDIIPTASAAPAPRAAASRDPRRTRWKSTKLPPTTGQFQPPGRPGLAPWNAGKDYYDADNDGCGSDGYHLGLDITVMDGSGRGAGDLAQFANGIEFGQWEYILKIEHGPDTACDDYTGITISIYTSCAADSCTQYQEQLNDDGSITVLHPVWHNSTYCDGSDDEDCENNAWDEDYEPFGCYYSPSFSIPNFGWDRCSSELGLEDDDTWVASDSGDTCTQTRRRRRRSLAALADDAKMRKWLKRDARAAPAAIRETSTTTIIHESRREHVVATAAAAVVLVASLAFVYVSQRKQTATLAKLEQRLDQILKLQGRDGAPPRGL
ncbi:glutathione transferase [Aureococcus anophagefferens]|nr:glutathione transferase [Aureococcus anophagefferens]